MLVTPDRLAASLRVQDIDFARGRLELQHAIVEVDGVQLDSEPKDYEASSIPVPASIFAELKSHVEGKEGGSPAFAAPAVVGCAVAFSGADDLTTLRL